GRHHKRELLGHGRGAAHDEGGTEQTQDPRTQGSFHCSHSRALHYRALHRAVAYARSSHSRSCDIAGWYTIPRMQRTYPRARRLTRARRLIRVIARYFVSLGLILLSSSALVAAPPA